MVETPKSETLTDNKKYTTLTHHNKTTQKIDKSLKKTQLQHSVHYKQQTPKTSHKQNLTQHQARKNTHPQEYTNLNSMTVSNSILVKHVDLSKHDILSI